MGHHANAQASLEASAKIHSRWIHEGRFISVRRDEIDFPDGKHKNWDIVVHPGAVGVVPLTKEGDLILVEQWRRTVGCITLEIPAGCLDPGETPETCANRELQEEIGYQAEELIPLGSYFSSPGILTEKIHLFIGKKLTPSRLIAEDTDEIDVRIVPFKTALKMIEEGIICDAKTALGILRMGAL